MSATDKPAPAKLPGHEPPPKRKRFYKAVAVVADGDAFGIQLDGRALKTPRKLPLCMPTRQLAEAVGSEWDAQGEHLEPASMQLTTLVFTAIDAVTDQRAAVAAEVGRYAMSDLICYRADAPVELVARQAKGWDPVLRWAEGLLGVQFKTTAGLMPVEQAPEVAQKMEKQLADATALDLAAMHVLTTLFGSALLALAVRGQRLTLNEAWPLAHLDEDWQAEKWGADAEAAARMSARRRTADAAGLLLNAVKLGAR